MEIFTTGAYLSPIQQRDGRWRWAVFGFEGNSFMDGDPVSVNIKESALTREKLINSLSDDPLAGYASGTIESKDLPKGSD